MNQKKTPHLDDRRVFSEQTFWGIGHFDVRQRQFSGSGEKASNPTKFEEPMLGEIGGENDIFPTSIGTTNLTHSLSLFAWESIDQTSPQFSTQSQKRFHIFLRQTTHNKSLGFSGQVAASEAHGRACGSSRPRRPWRSLGSGSVTGPFLTNAGGRGPDSRGGGGVKKGSARWSRARRNSWSCRREGRGQPENQVNNEKADYCVNSEKKH